MTLTTSPDFWRRVRARLVEKGYPMEDLKPDSWRRDLRPTSVSRDAYENLSRTNTRLVTDNARLRAALTEAEARTAAVVEALRSCVGYIESNLEDGCLRCGGDCSSAATPVLCCPAAIMTDNLELARAALEETTHD